MTTQMTTTPSGADVLAFLEQESKRFNPEHAETARLSHAAVGALIARNAELEAERDALRSMWRQAEQDVKALPPYGPPFTTDVPQCCESPETCPEPCDPPGARSLAEDAERYRLLRRGQHWSVVNGIGDTLRAEHLDAAIDLARTPAKENDDG